MSTKKEAEVKDVGDDVDRSDDVLDNIGIESDELSELRDLLSKKDNELELLKDKFEKDVDVDTSTERLSDEFLDFVIPDEIQLHPIKNRRRFHKLDTDALDQPIGLRCPVNDTTMLYDIGLTEDEIQWLNTSLNIRLTFDYVRSTPNMFWDSNMFKLTLSKDVLILKPKESPKDFILWKIALSSNQVANSKSDYDNGESSGATHYIYDEFETERVKSGKIGVLNQARKLSFELTPTLKVQILKVLENGSDYSQISSSLLDVKIDDAMNRDPAEFIKFCKMDSKDLALRSITIEAIARNIIRKNNNGYFFRDTYLGFNLDDVMGAMLNPENQDMKIGIFNMVQKIR